MRPLRPGLVSTIIPVHNRPVLLAEAVNSVLAQTYRPIEIIIVDSSTDRTPEVGRGLVSRHPEAVHYIWRRGLGTAQARNVGIDEASGEFVQFLDSDDLLMPDKFERQVQGLRANPACGISYAYTREYRLDGPRSERPARRTADTLAFLFPDILAGKIWPAPAPLFRRDVVDANGPFRHLSIYEDWEYECRAAARGVRLHHCQLVLADKRDAHSLEGRQKGGVSRDKLRDYLEAHERILAHARHAGVPAPAIDAFSRRLFAVARRCADAGFEGEARRGLALADGAAWSRLNRLRMAIYAGASDRLGWQIVGHWCERADHSALAHAARGVRRWPAAFWRRWHHRGTAALRTVRGQPILEWPALLANGWSARPSRRVRQIR